MSPATEQALRQAVAEHAGLVRNRLRQRLGRDDVDDALQDVLLAAMQSLASLRDPDAVRPWLLIVAEHKAVDHLRKKSRRARSVSLEHEVVDGDAENQVADAAAHAEVWQFVMRCMQELPTELQHLGRRHFVFGDSLAELGKALGRSKSTIQSQVDKVRSLLRQRLVRAGHAAFVPMLDVVRPLPADAGGTATAAAVGRRAVWHGLVAAGAVLVFGVWRWSSVEVAPAVAISASSGSARGAAFVASGAAQAPSEDVPVVRDSAAAPAIHGRVVDGGTGQPVPGALVHAFDCARGIRLDAVACADDGAFCLEATRGQRRPFEVYVAPPDAEVHGRVGLGALLPSVTARTVVLQPPVELRLTVTEDRAGRRPLRDVEVTVVDASAGRGWPAPSGAVLQQCSPPDFRVVARSVVPGALMDVPLPPLPRTRLAVFMREAGGATWFARLFEVPESVSEPRRSGSAATIRLLASSSWRPRHLPDPSALLRFKEGGGKALPTYCPDPDWYDLAFDYAVAVTAGARAKSPEPLSAFHDVAVLIGLPPAPVGDLAQSRRTVTLQMPFAPSHRGAAAESVEIVGTLYRVNPAELTELLGCSPAASEVTFQDVPVGEPLRLDVLSGYLQETHLQALVHLEPASERSIDATAALRSIDVATSCAGQPLPGCAIEVRKAVAAGSESTLRSGWSDGLAAETDSSGRVRMHVVGFDAHELRITAPLPSGRVVLHTSGTSDASGALPSRHEFDFGVGFELRVAQGGQPLQVAAGRSVWVEGELLGTRRHSFRQVVEVADRGVVRVFPGSVGHVRARLCVAVDGREDAAWAEEHAFEATSRALDGGVAVPLRLPAAPPSGALVTLRLSSADGRTLLLDGVGLDVEARQPRPLDQLDLVEPRPWLDAPWRATGDGLVEVELPLATSAAELRVLLPGWAPAVFVVPGMSSWSPGPILVALKPVREVVVGSSLDRELREGRNQGLLAGDVLCAVGGRSITTRTDLARAIAELPEDQAVVLRLRRAGADLEVTLASRWRPFLRWLEQEGVAER